MLHGRIGEVLLSLWCCCGLLCCGGDEAHCGVLAWVWCSFGVGLGMHCGVVVYPVVN